MIKTYNTAMQNLSSFCEGLLNTDSQELGELVGIETLINSFQGLDKEVKIDSYKYDPQNHHLILIVHANTSQSNISWVPPGDPTMLKVDSISIINSDGGWASVQINDSLKCSRPFRLVAYRIWLGNIRGRNKKIHLSNVILDANSICVKTILHPNSSVQIKADSIFTIDPKCFHQIFNTPIYRGYVKKIEYHEQRREHTYKDVLGLPQSMYSYLMDMMGSNHKNGQFKIHNSQVNPDLIQSIQRTCQSCPLFNFGTELYILYSQMESRIHIKNDGLQSYILRHQNNTFDLYISYSQLKK